jgi:predicted nucleic acid-binding protein
VEGLVYLVDTNIFLEALLDQERRPEVESFLEAIDWETISITDFSLYSIGIRLFRLKRFTLFLPFLEDLIGNGIVIRSLNLEDLKTLDQLMQEFNLDFDDAYQYAVAEKYDLQLISFDKDFDRTERNRKEPIEILG